MKKVFFLTVLFVMAAALLAGCAETDVVRKYSPDSLLQIVEKYPDLVTDAAMSGMDSAMTGSDAMTDHYYSLTADGETSLTVSHDYSLTGQDDIMIETPLQPFEDAGLDPSQLGAGYKTADGMLYLTADYGSGSGQKDNITDALFESVNADRSVLTYHQQLDHYGIKLAAGKFEWAKDYTKNDKDIVFVIRAQPLLDLGVDVHNIAGWTFSTVQDTDGSNVDVLLKAYDLDGE